MSPSNQVDLLTNNVFFKKNNKIPTVKLLCNKRHFKGLPLLVFQLGSFQVSHLSPLHHLSNNINKQSKHLQRGHFLFVIEASHLV